MGQVLLIGSGGAAGLTDAEGSDVHVDWSKITQELSRIRGELGNLFYTGSGETPLESVAIELGVSATGEVGIIVSKASVTVGTRVTLTFERPKG